MRGVFRAKKDLIFDLAGFGEFDRAFLEMNFGWLQLKHKDGFADCDLVAIAQNLFCYRKTIDQGSVLASEITQKDLIGLTYKQAVAT